MVGSFEYGSFRGLERHAMEMSDYIHVGLMSGRAVRVQATVERPLKHIRLQAQSALQTGLGVLRDSKARIFEVIARRQAKRV